MKKIISGLLTALMISTAFSGCSNSMTTPQVPSASSVSTELTVSESLDSLFTTIDLMDAAISELLEEMEAGHVTSEQLTQMYIDRIEAYDEKLNLNSIIAINPKALDDARELDAERSEGKIRGPLHGIPIVVKANMDVAGMATSAGAALLADMVAEEDSFVVKQLKEAGAVILAQANMSEFAYSAESSRSTLGGYVHNAYDTSKTPAGSSGGTAVAVTSNFAAAGIGTDTGGSIRNPSSCANLYGIRPSKGLTSISGVFPLKAYRDTTGPMARTAEDMALLLEVIAGSDEGDDYTLEADADTLLGDGYTDSLSADALSGMRIGYLESSFSYSAVTEEAIVFDVANQKIDAMLHKSIANLRKAGAEIVNLTDILTTDMITSMSEGIETDPFEYDVNKFLNEKGDAAKYKTVKELADTGTGGILQMYLNWIVAGKGDLAASLEETTNPYTEKFGAYQRIPEWQQILDGRAAIAKVLEENDIDAVMYLTFFDVAADETESYLASRNKAEYDSIFGPKLGLPEISLPMGFSDANIKYKSEMPLGLSIFAGFGQEEKLMQIAYAYEQQAGDIIRRMPAKTPALEDKELNAFLEDLIDKAYLIDSSKIGNKLGGKMQLLMSAAQKAIEVDRKDPYATYEAARALAEAYDKLMLGLAE